MSDPMSRLDAALEGRYAIERELGEGGMATVYLAQDIRHQRKVALKVLKPELAAVIGAERFLTEIRTTANLQHPHILPLFDSGEVDGLLYYVMPYIEGESLRERLERERQLPVEDAVRIAGQVASALDYAHEQGVIHRDIKPGNILLSRGGPVVSDFGIALAVTSAGGGRLTETGLSLGTPNYMSPEQATAEAQVGPATDIFALGCVLFEMLVGEPPFRGATAQAVLGKIITSEPVRPTEHRAAVPPHVEAVVLKAIQKVPADRFQSAGGLAEALSDEGFRLGTPNARTQGVGRGWSWSDVLLGGLAVVFGALYLSSMIGGGGSGDEAVVTRQRVVLSDISLQRNSLALRTTLAPDGSSIVYTDTIGGVRQLWEKRRAALQPRPLTGTSGASVQAPTISPDGAWVAFMADGVLKKVPREGGPAIELASRAATSWSSMAWMDDGSIVFNQDDWSILLVGEEGGPVDTLYAREVGQPFAVGIEGLPGGRGVLWIGCNDQCTLSGLHVIDLESGVQTPLLEQVVWAKYLPTGHLTFVRRDGGVFAAPFDLQSLAFEGEPLPVLQGVRTGRQYADIQVGADGTVYYVAGPPAEDESNLFDLVWVTRDGTVEPLDTTWVEVFSSPGISPDGERVAVEVQRAGERHVWVRELPAGALTRTTVEGDNHEPRWESDGEWLTYLTTHEDGSDLYRTRADGSGTAELLVDVEPSVEAGFYSRDGQWLVYRTSQQGESNGDVFALREDGDTTPVLTTPFRERGVALSPDGRWLAYVSNSSGADEVYVSPFPDAGSRRVQISIGGGRSPVWSRDGTEIFYRDGEGWMVAVPVVTSGAFERGAQTRLFDWAGRFRESTSGARYDVSIDGRRFLMIRRGANRPEDEGELILIQNWFAELEGRLGGD